LSRFINAATSSRQRTNKRIANGPEEISLYMGGRAAQLARSEGGGGVVGGTVREEVEGRRERENKGRKVRVAATGMVR